MRGDLTIYIPTYGRVGAQATYDAIPDDWAARTMLVAEEDEALYLDARGYNVIACPVQGPGDGKGIAATRQWILDQHDVELFGSNVLMMDDDLHFARRRKDDRAKFVPADDIDLRQMLHRLAGMFEFSPMIGVAARSGANRVTDHYRLNERMFKVLGVHVPTFREEGFKADRVPLMEDFDLSLQFLTHGYPTLMLNDYVVDDARSNAAGGCSTYRDTLAQAEAAWWMAEHWPGLVTTVDRPGWGGLGESRVDVRVAWKKAFLAGKTWRAGNDIPFYPEFDWAGDQLFWVP